VSDNPITLAVGLLETRQLRSGTHGALAALGALDHEAAVELEAFCLGCAERIWRTDVPCCGEIRRVLVVPFKDAS
jgi:hypothetical protein